ncbi:GYDIA family GHMP kinase [Aequorivita vitellina]|uniref:GYDIA family GHMP kinase n=1 Tax=Aequorivita vitellina TaxID=2874475 RepID=UPI001F2C1FFF|nr:GYDIA family GHMP kinase [Aequorivita vitellina]
MKKTLHSNGKLLLTGEYVVLDGATALAIPTKYGQFLEVDTFKKKAIHWKSFDEKGAVWFEDFFDLKNFEFKNEGDKISKTLSKILREARKLNPDFLSEDEGIQVTTKLEFPRNWGLGTSSTLINNIAQWANVNAFQLLKHSFGGSGYDIAAAQNNVPVLYEFKNETPEFKEVSLPWNFKANLFFVYLNQKQDSKEGISQYRKNEVDEKIVQKISAISRKLPNCNSLSEFEKLMNLHEQLISEIIKSPTIKEQLFNDYPHTIKSLGAWGGDFVLATGAEKDMDYFRKKGFKTVIPFSKMIY